VYPIIGATLKNRSLFLSELLGDEKEESRDESDGIDERDDKRR
jgi:hypothetical protein